MATLARLLSVNEARERLGSVGRDAFYALVNEGRLEARKIGRRTFVSEESLEKCIRHLPTIPRRASASREDVA
jgi:excisionase family DNA binding protein